MPSAYRLGLDITSMGVISGEDLRAVSQERGGTLVILGAAALDVSTPTATMDLKRGYEVTYRDQRSSHYFRRRFEPEFPDSLKALLLLIEGDLTTALTPHAAHGGRPRARRFPGVHHFPVPLVDRTPARLKAIPKHGYCVGTKV